MANGASRLFNIMKMTGEATNISPSQIITLTVKSTSPIVFQRDDRLEIPIDFCTFTDDSVINSLNVGDKVKAIVLNDGQSYYIQYNPSGIGDKNYIHKQLAASTTWTINHNLEKFPSVTVQDSAGTNIIGEVTYIDNNNLTITFSDELSGKAYLN